jgi:hypothetical protein
MSKRSTRDNAHCRVCGKPATHEVRNNINDVIEILCEKDAKTRAKYLNAEGEMNA